MRRLATNRRHCGVPMVQVRTVETEEIIYTYNAPHGRFTQFQTWTVYGCQTCDYELWVKKDPLEDSE